MKKLFAVVVALMFMLSVSGLSLAQEPSTANDPASETAVKTKQTQKKVKKAKKVKKTKNAKKAKKAKKAKITQKPQKTQKTQKTEEAPGASSVVE